MLYFVLDKHSVGNALLVDSAEHHIGNESYALRALYWECHAAKHCIGSLMLSIILGVYSAKHYIAGQRSNI